MIVALHQRRAGARRSRSTTRALAGHQIMPSLAFAGGKLMVAYYDFQHDVSGVFRKFVDETSAVIFGNKRHTVDVRAAMAAPAPRRNSALRCASPST